MSYDLDMAHVIWMWVMQFGCGSFDLVCESCDLDVGMQFGCGLCNLDVDHAIFMWVI